MLKAYCDECGKECAFESFNGRIAMKDAYTLHVDVSLTKTFDTCGPEDAHLCGTCFVDIIRRIFERSQQRAVK